MHLHGLREHLNLINELYGYDPVKREVRANQEKFGNTEQGAGVRQTHLADYLKAQFGFKVIGAGSSYAKVLIHPNLSYVIKLFARDPCYLAFVRLCQAQRPPNPHFPRFIGKPIVLPADKKIFGIRMEKLEDANLTRFDADVEAISQYQHISRFIAHEGNGSTFELGQLEKAKQRVVDRFGQSFAEAVVLVQEIINQKSIPCRGDLHHENIMKRGSTYVIIDPVAP